MSPLFEEEGFIRCVNIIGGIMAGPIAPSMGKTRQKFCQKTRYGGTQMALGFHGNGGRIEN
jgi:hypothetical protein